MRGIDGRFIKYKREKANCLFCKREIEYLLNLPRKFCSLGCNWKFKTGKKRALEIGVKISLAKKGKVVISEKQKEQIRKKLTGRKLPLSVRRKMSERMKGKPFSGRQATNEEKHTLEARRKRSEANRGEKSWNWKGGIYPLHLKIRKSIEGRRWREKVLERDGYRCLDCGEQESRLEVDHIYSFSAYPRLRFMIENGRVLCRPCHTKTSNYGIKLKTIVGVKK